MDIKQLRDKFFRECCCKEDGVLDVSVSPETTFEWFVKHLGKSITPTMEEIVNRSIEYADVKEETRLAEHRVKEAAHFITGATWAVDYIKTLKEQ